LSVPRLTYGPSLRRRRTWGLGRSWLARGAPEHLALALDAALALAWHRHGPEDRVARVAAEPALLARTRSTTARERGRKFAQRGMWGAEPATVDAEVTTRSGAVVRVELLSRSYRRLDVGDKVSSSGDTAYVCTSRTVAARLAYENAYARYLYLD
jgi:hypothetical protein